MRSVVRLVRSRPRSADAVLAVALAALAELEIWTLDSTDPPRPVLAAAALVAMPALAWRRRAPLASATVALGAIALLSAFWRLDGAWPAFAFLVALYSVAMHSELRAALIGAGLGLTAGALGTLAEDNDSIVGHVLMKLGVRDRVQAVIFAYETGVVGAGSVGSGSGAVP